MVEHGPAIGIGALRALVVVYPIQYGPFVGGCSRPFTTTKGAICFARKVRKTGRFVWIERFSAYPEGTV